jgi:hypothetical protein
MMRYARYAAAIVFALLAVGFVALWVRSNEWNDRIAGPVSDARSIVCNSYGGDVTITWLRLDRLGWFSQWRLSFLQMPLEEEWRWHRNVPEPLILFNPDYFNFNFNADSERISVTLPYWFLAASSLGLAALFAFKRTWRFSLRTILVVTTLLAALLGLAVYVV